MAITQLSTANTFQQWLIATQALITTANTLTDGNGASFIANTKLDVSGTGSQLNVRNSAGINTLYANNLFVGGSNVTTLNVSTSGYIGGDLQVDGNVTVSGNIILDSIGFDDIIANGSIEVGNNLTVSKNTTLNNVTATYSNFSTANVTILTGSANTAIYSNITLSQAFATSAGSYANSAFLQANTPSYTANSGSAYANSAFVSANSGAVYANSAFTAANNAIDSAVALSIALG
jgi:cytoskeletal protein CcmA (bactofilin family)